MDKYKNTYRIESARLQNWDYGANGAYFITICTKNRQHFFGQIIDGQLIASDCGKIAEQIWLEIPTHFPFVELGNFVIMPNHTHGILIINTSNTIDHNNDNHNNGHDVETRLIASLHHDHYQQNQPTKTKINGGFSALKNPMLHENISQVIRWYKGRCSFEMRKIHEDFAWQSRFHDHIIRDTASFDRIQTYIENNPNHWNEDTFYGE